MGWNPYELDSFGRTSPFNPVVETPSDPYKFRPTPTANYNQARKNLKEYNAMDSIERRRISAQRTIERAERELARLESLPKEPTLADDPNPIIYFVKSFGGSREYDYAALKAGDGKWYTTGPRSPKGYTWAELVDWMFSEGDEPVIMIGTKWKTLDA